MIVGIVGLGMIGGSFAKAIKDKTTHTVFGCDKLDVINKQAVLFGAIDGELTEDKIEECDVVIFCTFPKRTIEYIKSYAGRFKRGALVMDVCGVKGEICREIFPVAEENGFDFIGGHPMAGVEQSGFKYSDASLLEGRSMILVPPKGMPIARVNEASQFCKSIGFASTPVASPDEHDRIIAYTSQINHVVAGAYIKSPMALEKKFSAGSFLSMSRVAALDEELWTELMMQNAEHLANEIDGLADRMKEYSKAMRSGDADRLHELLKEGRLVKERSEKGV